MTESGKKSSFKEDAYLHAMKTKLKKIAVNEQEFLFTVSRDYGNPGKVPSLSVRVFLAGFKNTPLTVFFDTHMDYTGNPFFSGVLLQNKATGEQEEINANFPGLIRKYIFHGKEQGWTGENTIDPVNGIRVLGEWGYDTSKLTYDEFDAAGQKTVKQYD